MKEPEEKFGSEAIMRVCDSNEVVGALEVMRREASGRWVFIPVWNKLYKRSLWDDIRFPEGKRYEDEAIFHHIIKRCNKIALLLEPLYHYLINPKGFMASQESAVLIFERLYALERRLCDYIVLGDDAIISGTFSQFHFYLIETVTKLEMADEKTCQGIRDIAKRISSYEEHISMKSMIQRIELHAFCAYPTAYLRIRLLIIRLKHFLR